MLRLIVSRSLCYYPFLKNFPPLFISRTNSYEQWNPLFFLAYCCFFYVCVYYTAKDESISDRLFLILIILFFFSYLRVFIVEKITLRIFVKLLSPPPNEGVMFQVIYSLLLEQLFLFFIRSNLSFIIIHYPSTIQFVYSLIYFQF